MASIVEAVEGRAAVNASSHTTGGTQSIYHRNHSGPVVQPLLPLLARWDNIYMYTVPTTTTATTTDICGPWQIGLLQLHVIMRCGYLRCTECGYIDFDIIALRQKSCSITAKKHFSNKDALPYITRKNRAVSKRKVAVMFNFQSSVKRNVCMIPVLIKTAKSKTHCI